MKELMVKELYTLNETIAKDIFEGVTYPWEVLPKISEFIIKLGETLPEEEYEKRGTNLQRFLSLPTLTVRPLSGKMRR